MNVKDKRMQRRKPMRYTAWLALGPNDLHGCVLSDISDSGARIDVEDSGKVPDRFFLFLSSNGAARRVCRVMWRKPTQLGVKFERSFAEAGAAAPAGGEADKAPAAPAPATETA